MAIKYKVAVIGTGGRGRDWINRIHKHKGLALKAICDINLKIAKKIAQDHANCNVYTDVNDLLKKESLDFCVIATPHYLHAPQTVLCAENEVSVLCEKPMAINLQQADQMIIAARKNCVTLGIGFQFRFKPIFKYLYDAARGAKGNLGDLGRITDFSMVARHYRGDLYYLSSSNVDPETGVTPGPWRGRWETEGAGILINQAVHDIDIFQWITGPFKSLSAHAATIAKEHALIEVEDTVSASFTTKSGAIGTIMLATSNKKSLPDHYIVQGENGYVSSTASYGNQITGDTRYKDEEDWEVPFNPSLGISKNESIFSDELLNDFINAMANDTDPVVPGEEGRKSVEIIRAILKSVQEERNVHFPVKDTMTYPTLNNLSRESPDEMRKAIYRE